MTRFRRLILLWLLVTITLSLSAAIPPAKALAPEAQTCTNLIANSGFEARHAWQRGNSASPARYVQSPVFDGFWAMQMGIRNQPNVNAYSSIRQRITIPSNASSAQVTFWVWTESEAGAGADKQELLLLPPGANERSGSEVAVLWRVLLNNPSWQQVTIPLNDYIGGTFDLYFNAYNDGFGGRTAMIVDNVSVTSCTGMPPTPSPTPTPPGSGVTISWVGDLNPSGNNPQTIDDQSALFVTVDVYAPGVTESVGQGAGIGCSLHFGEVNFFGEPWFNTDDVPMAYYQDAGNNDRYAINMGPLPAGLYEYTAWCSGNGGATKIWSDNSATGGNGRLTIIATTVTPAATGTPIPTAAPTFTPWPTLTTTPGVVINSVSNLYPGGNNPQTIDSTSALYISVDVFARYVTDSPGQGQGIFCFLHYGNVASFGGPWTNIIDAPMYYSGDAPGGSADRYGINLGSLSAGLYEYTAWCSGNGGTTKVWADTSAGGNGRLTVIGSPTAYPTSWPTVYPTVWPTAYPTLWPTVYPTVWPTVYPTVWPTVAPTVPAGCVDLIENGGFEWDGTWFLGETARPAAYVPTPYYAGTRSMRLGIAQELPNVDSFSSIRQDVYVPADTPRATIRFRYYPESYGTAGNLNYQELVLLDPNRGGATIELLWRVTENTSSWLLKEFDITRHRGKLLTVYFNVRNDGTRGPTAMYLDDVALLSCSEPLPVPVPYNLPKEEFIPFEEFMPPPEEFMPPPIDYMLTPPVVLIPDDLDIERLPTDILAPDVTVVTVEATGTTTPWPGIEDAMTPVPSSDEEEQIPTGGSPLQDILRTLAPWAGLLLLTVIVAVTVAVLASFLG
ncbi:MAG: PT domain-containing protein [Chloroflexota bacterium]|nr:PT domain-containing protein [Chloroflexota bacterium]